MIQGLAEVVLHHRKQAPQDAEAKDHRSGEPERHLYLVGRRRIYSEQPLCMINGLSNVTRDEQLEQGRRQGGGKSDNNPNRVVQYDTDNPAQDAEVQFPCRPVLFSAG